MDPLLDEDLSEEIAPTDRTTDRYRMCYDTFMKWHESNEMTAFDEDVLLAYFSVVSETYKSSTLKSMYSMLKKTLFTHHNVDMGSYKRLLDAINKEYSVGYKRAKAIIFSSEEINRFMTEAPDEHYLAMKVKHFGYPNLTKTNEFSEESLSLTK